MDDEKDPQQLIETTKAMSEDAIREWRDQMKNSLELWKEGGGYLVPTEPDPDEREKIRENLRTSIETLDRVLGENSRRRRVKLRG